MNSRHAAITLQPVQNLFINNMSEEFSYFDTNEASKEKLNCMELSIKLLRYLGSWPYWNRSHTRSEQLYLSYSAIMIILFTIYMIIQIYGLTVYYHTWETLEAAIEDFIVVVTGAIVFAKVILIVWNQKKLQELIDYINHYLNTKYVKSEEEYNIVKFCVKHENRLTKTYLSFAYCIFFLYTASSVAKIIKFRSSNEYHDTLPLKYPFKLQKFPMYHIAYMHQLIIMLINAQVGTCVDSFFSCLVFYICGHFTIIKKNLQRKKIISKRFVIYHQELIRLVGKVQDIFGIFLLFQFTFNSFLICLALFQITQITDIKLMHYLKCLIYLTVKLTQLFLYCWYGQEVIERSAQVSFAAYCTNWYNISYNSMTRNLKFVLLRSQKPVQMTAGKFFLVSLVTFRSVIHTAYSFFALLNTFRQ